MGLVSVSTGVGVAESVVLLCFSTRPGPSRWAGGSVVYSKSQQCAVIKSGKSGMVASSMLWLQVCFSCCATVMLQ